MTLILSIETSTSLCSLALHEQGKLLAVAEVAMEKSHSKNIIPLINELYEATGKKMSETEAYAVSMGPGSYTGLRIGVSTAKGFCYAGDKPLIAVNTLEAMAMKVSHYQTEAVLLCPMIDARRMEVYTALYKSGKEVKATEAMILDENSLSEYSSEKVICFGNGSDKFRELAKSQGNIMFLDAVNPSAEGVGILAWKKFQEKKFEDVAYFEPYYLKEFVSTGLKK